MEIDPNYLPNDAAALRQMVVGLRAEVAERDRKLRQLQHWLEQLLRARYGPRREHVDENQLFLFAAEILAQGGKTPPASEESQAPASNAKPGHPRLGHGRGALPKSLKREARFMTLRKTGGNARNASGS
ncbi:MAG TPA: transposase [Terriglobia bacterium]|nr:transposase [Terriglobia bacterium]